MRPSLLFLIGYRGSGKSTVAPHLAQRLGYEVLDSDGLVETEAGMSIAKIFAAEGEAAFRDWEAAVVGQLCERKGAVVALGGGAVLRDENRRRIIAAGPIAWLSASVDTLAARIQSDPTTRANRPNLTATGGRDEIAAVLAERIPIYRACATLVVDTEGKTPAQVADEIVRELKLQDDH